MACVGVVFQILTYDSLSESLVQQYRLVKLSHYE